MTPSHAERARTLVHVHRKGTLATLAHDPPGYPYGSLVLYAPDERGDPLFLLSELAEHTQNLRRDPRGSLLVSEGELTTGRVTVLGTLLEEESAREPFVACHPEAAQYAGFKDFHGFRLRVEAVRYIAGFGRMSWVSAEDYRGAEPDPIAPLAEGIRTHMNEDHEEHMLMMARHFAGIEASSARLLEVDRYGFEMTLDGTRRARVDFPRPVTTSDHVRQAMVELVRQARLSPSA